MNIREASDSDLNDVLLVEKEAFGYVKESNLVKGLLSDPSAKPLYSLLAFIDDRAVGHVLFTSARLEDTQNGALISILAPLAVIPDFQKIGVGGKLIERGLQHLANSGVDLVFVLGHPERPGNFDDRKRPFVDFAARVTHDKRPGGNAHELHLRGVILGIVEAVPGAGRGRRFDVDDMEAFALLGI